MIEEAPTQTPTSVALDLASALDESTHAAMCSLVRTVREIGPDAAYDLAARALFIEATGGLPLPERWGRKRTPGGVFFYLLKAELDDAQHLRIFQRPRKPAAEVSELRAEVSELQPATPARSKQAAPAKPPTRPCANCGQQADVVGKFHFGPTGKRCICGPCTDLGYVFGPAGVVVQLQEAVG